MAQAQPISKTHAARDWPFAVLPLHPVLGCEITGITLEQAESPALFAKVYEAFLEYQLIVFHDVDLPPATQVAFARNFGEVQVHVLSDHYGIKDHPEIYRLSNLDRDGNPSGKHPDKGTLYWHTDGSWRERTGQATMMYSEIVPDIGGETEFADMYSAYALLPAAMKRRIEGRRAIHNLDFSRSRRHGEDLLTAEQKAKVPPIAHPIVRTHPETGRKALYINIGHTVHFKDMTEAESAPLLNFLFEHQTKPEFTCRFNWRVGSLAFWDNRCALHNPVNDYHGFRRVMHRVTLAGDTPR